MPRRGAWVGLVLLLCCLPAAGQTLRDLSTAVRDVWTTREGLPHNTVNAIAQTPDGYLWIATWEGLIRYNGREFRRFDRQHVSGMPDDGVRALAVSADGALWVGTARGGLARLHQDRWEFPQPAGSLVTGLLEDRRGRLWIATEASGLERIDADGGRRRFGRAEGLPADAVYALSEDADGRIWVATAAGLVSVVQDRVETLPADSGLPAEPVYALDAEHDGGVLIGAQSGAYVLREGRLQRLPDSVAGKAVFQVLSLAEGERFIGTVGDGLFRQWGDSVEQIGQENGLPNQRIAALFADREHNLWVGTNSGLVRLRDAPLTTLTRFNGLADDYVRAVLGLRNGDVLVGSSRGLSRIRGGRVEAAPSGDPLAEKSILSLAEDRDGSVWVGTFASGLLRWQNGRVLERWDRDRGLDSNEVRAILPASNGDLWIGHALGLTRVRDGALRHFGRADGLPGFFIVSLRETPDGSIWVGTANGAAVIRGERIESLPMAAMGGAEFVFGFDYQSEGDRLWMSTDRGLVSLRIGDGQMRHLGLAAGLPVEKVFQSVIDSEGAFWLSSNRGMIRIAAGSVDAYLAGRVAQLDAVLLGESDGMASSQCNGGSMPAMSLATDGTVWTASAVGVVAARPNSLKGYNSTPPQVVIESLRADGAALSRHGVPTVAAGTQRIELHFAGLSFLTPAWIRYRTRLEGFDSDWVERGTRRAAEYTNLPPGRYRFLVEAANPDSGWSQLPAEVEFQIDAYVWQWRGFWWGVSLLVVLVAVIANRWRFAQLRASERRQRELVELRTSDLRLQTEQLIRLDRQRDALVEKLRQQSDAFERQAREDGLTGLLNRRGFDERLVQAMQRSATAPLCLALFDVDHFKKVNDRYSHSAGDQVLCAVADVLRAEISDGTVLARWGGEEFVVLLPGSVLQKALERCEQVRIAVERLDVGAIAPQLLLTLSVGVAQLRSGESREHLLQRADAALYRAKKAGRNRVCTSPTGVNPLPSGAADADDADEGADENAVSVAD